MRSMAACAGAPPPSPALLPPPRRAYAKSMSYAHANMGAVPLTDAIAIDEVYSSLARLTFDRFGDPEDKSLVTFKASLHNYQIVALSNLNPPSVAAAKSLIPSLGVAFMDDEVQQILDTMRSMAAKQLQASVG